MRRLFILLCIVAPFSAASAETPASKEPADNRHSQHSTGKTELKDNGQMQPQGPTGPITTGTGGGAPAESPQGQTPPNMQAAPEGSSKTISGPDKK
jgi:hypothetical protein